MVRWRIVSFIVVPESCWPRNQAGCATDIEVEVRSREVTLSGQVANRMAKRRAEDIAESVSGVTHVQNNLRIRQDTGIGSSTAPKSSSFSAASKSKPSV
jgi:hypothetical protein